MASLFPTALDMLTLATTARRHRFPPYPCDVALALGSAGDAGPRVRRRDSDSVMENPRTKNAIIIRMYSVKTEEEMVNVIAKRFARDDQASDNPSSMADNLELSITSLVLAAYAQFQRRPFGVKNKCYITHHQPCHLDVDDRLQNRNHPHPKADTHKHHMFNIRLDKMEKKEPLDDEESMAYTTHKNRLREHTISLANAIITTVSKSRGRYPVQRLQASAGCC